MKYGMLRIRASTSHCQASDIKEQQLVIYTVT